jgi:hypothetical protein
LIDSIITPIFKQCVLSEVHDGLYPAISPATLPTIRRMVDITELIQAGTAVRRIYQCVEFSSHAISKARPNVWRHPEFIYERAA